MAHTIEFSLLHDLDHHLGKPHHHSLEETAADGDLFLEHNVRFDHTNSLAEACHVFDLSTALLARLECRHAGYHEAETNDSPHCRPQYWSIHDEKTVANLEHLFYSLQQDAWDALVQHFLRIIDADRDHWDRYWQQMGQLDDGWFAEWPNGRRPLSTTWPWNIKPSLVVLWGVCWMFVDPERITHNDAGRSRGGGRLPWSNLGHAQAQAQAPTLCEFDKLPDHESIGTGSLAKKHTKTKNQMAKVSRLDMLAQCSYQSCRLLLACHQPRRRQRQRQRQWQRQD